MPSLMTWSTGCQRSLKRRNPTKAGLSENPNDLYILAFSMNAENKEKKVNRYTYHEQSRGITSEIRSCLVVSQFAQCPNSCARTATTSIGSDCSIKVS